MARNRIIDEFEDLNTEAPDTDDYDESDASEEESDAIFAETTGLVEEIDDDDVAELDRQYQEARARLLEEKGLSGDKGSDRGKPGKGSKGDKEFEWRPANTLDAPAPRPGMTQRWVRFLIGEKDDAKNWSRSTREGWKPRSLDTVKPGFNAPTMNHSVLGTVIQVGDLILCEMDSKLYRSRKKFFADKAKRQTQAMERKGIDGTPIKVEERKQSVSYGRRRAQATE